VLPLSFFPQLQRLVLDELSRDERGRRRPLTPELPTRRGSPWRVQCTLGTDGQIETLDARKLGVPKAGRGCGASGDGRRRGLRGLRGQLPGDEVKDTELALGVGSGVRGKRPLLIITLGNRRAPSGDNYDLH
jgi:hypothetical protein